MMILIKLKKYFVLLILCFVFIFSPAICIGKLSLMNEKDMKASVGQAGFTEFSMNDNTARLFLDIHIESIATIGTFSAGKHSDWDLQFKDIEIGNTLRDAPLTVDGLVFIVDFDDSSNLQRVVIGSNRLHGDISARMNMYSGVYNNSLTGGSGSPVYLLDGASVGVVTAPDPERTTFSFDSTPEDMGMFFVLTNEVGKEGEAGKVGFQIVSGYNETSLADLTTNWWDSP